MDQINGVIEAIEDRDNNLYRVYFNKAAIPDSLRGRISGKKQVGTRRI
jgi:hypothetical protein